MNHPQRAKAAVSAGFLRCAVLISFLCYALVAHLPARYKLVSAASGSCHLRELEVCLVGVGSLLQNPNGLPANEEEMKRQCEFLNESASCFEDYAQRCLINGQSAIAAFISGPVFELKYEFCRKGTELWNSYLKEANCLRDVQRKHQTNCVTDFQVGFENIHKTNRSMRLPTACCNLNRLKNCLLPRVEELCGESALDMVNGLLSKVVGKLPTTICRNYDSTQTGGQCETLLPKVGSKPHCEYYGRNTSVISRLVSSYALKQPEAT